MTPEEHWTEAERLIDAWQQATDDLMGDDNIAAQISAAAPLISAILAAAQVHATLALAGATLLAGSAGYDAARDRLADAMLGVQR